MTVVATKIAPNGQRIFIQNSPAERGIETTLLAGNARAFVDQAGIDTYVQARGGSAGDYQAVTFPDAELP